MRESSHAKALRYLTEGRLIVTSVDRDRVASTCRGDGTVHLQAYSSGMWRCTCPVRTDQCAHLRALRHVVAVDLKERR